MIAIYKRKLLLEKLDAFRAAGKKVGFVPTMGALHEGHIFLVKRAREQNDIVVTSIFVNPTQFNNKNDLLHYPRTLEADSKMLEAAGCDFLFVPDVQEMYPDGVEEKVPFIDLAGLDKVMEGAHRPGH